MKQWYSVALPVEHAEQLKALLKQNGIYFEPSSCYNLIHFEMKLDEVEHDMVDAFLETL